MAIQEFPLGQFLPDATDYKSPGLVVCNNVYALPNSYTPLQDLMGQGIFVYGDIRGAFRFDLSDGDQLLVVGTEADLYVIRGDFVTASGLSLSLQQGEFWSFDQFGESIFATTKQGGLYRLPSMLSDNAFTAGLGSPPRAKAVNVVGDFLFLGNLVETGEVDAPYRVRWSAYNNPNDQWTTDVARQSGFVDMPSRFGGVTAIYGGSFDLVFQNHGISRIWYSGGPTVFAKEVIEDDRGCVAQTSIARVGGFVYFLSHDGFCRTDGASVEVISSNKIWDWFSKARNKNDATRVQAAVNWSKRSIIWSFNAYRTAKADIAIDATDPDILDDETLDVDGPSFDDDGVQIIYSQQVIYNWGLDQWTTAEIGADWLVQSNIIGVSLDRDDPAIADDAELDSDAEGLDAGAFAPKGRELAAFRGNQLGFFVGDPLRATFETGDFQPKTGNRSFVRSAMPIVETSERALLASVAGRDYIGDAKTYGPNSAQSTLMFCPVISDARFHSLRITIPEGTEWDKASGFQIDWEASGIA